MSAPLDELTVRRQAKLDQTRIMVNAYGDDGYVLIDCSLVHARALRDELNALVDQ